SVPTVAPGAIPRVQRVERDDLTRRELASVRLRPARHRVTGGEGHRCREGEGDESCHRGEPPRAPRPVASTPARSIHGRVCAVATGVAVATTQPVVMPNAI